MDRNGAKLSAGSAALAMIPTWVRCTPHRPSLCCINGEYGCNTLVLQWGHRLSAMETATALGIWTPVRFPSMGPPPFGGGNALTVRGVALFDEPSMGPPPFGDGNVGLGGFQALGCGPSMGPPPFGDGNSRIARRQCCRQSAFHGATAFRRWKPLLVARLRHGFIQKRVFPQEPVTG